MLLPSSFDSNCLRNLSVTNTLTENNKTQAWIRHSQATVHSCNCPSSAHKAVIRGGFKFLLLAGLWCISVSLGTEWRTEDDGNQQSRSFLLFEYSKVAVIKF
jgi:hypothetical protein